MIKARFDYKALRKEHSTVTTLCDTASWRRSMSASGRITNHFFTHINDYDLDHSRDLLELLPHNLKQKVLRHTLKILGQFQTYFQNLRESSHFSEKNNFFGDLVVPHDTEETDGFDILRFISLFFSCNDFHKPFISIFSDLSLIISREVIHI